MMKKIVSGRWLRACMALLLCFSSVAYASAQSAIEIFEQEGRWGNGVSKRYEKFLKTPIEATIKAIHRRWGKSKFTYEAPSGEGPSSSDPVSITFVTITAGTTQGVTRGMIFRIIETGEDVRIIRTAASTSVGMIVRHLDEKGRETFYDNKTQQESIYPKVRVGWRLTTSPF